MEKQIHNMTNEEILRQQLVLLAEASRGAMDMELGPLSTAMVEVCKLLSAPTKTTMSPGGSYGRERQNKRSNEEELRIAGNAVKAITGFTYRELEAAEQAKKREKKQVYINPDSLIGKEIRYQTALLHEILHELRNRG